MIKLSIGVKPAVLLALDGRAVGGGTLLGTGTFTTVAVERSVAPETADDASLPAVSDESGGDDDGGNDDRSGPEARPRSLLSSMGTETTSL